MAKPATPRDAISVVIPVHNAANQLEKIVAGWGDALSRLDRVYEILVVDDGSSDGTHTVIEKLVAGRVRHVVGLKHEKQLGFGASLRTALEQVQYPLLCYTSPDYPYSPNDIRKLLDRIEVRDEALNKQPDLISGCRIGKRVPPELKWLGKAWRLFWRITVGLHLEPLPAWLGTKPYVFGWFVGWVFGVPLADVNSAFKLYRTRFLKQFPIQSEGDFVHTELVAKATFLTSIIDELPLTPVTVTEPVVQPASTTGTSSIWRDFWKVFKNPEFTHLVTPPSPSPEPEKNERPPVGGSPEAATHTESPVLPTIADPSPTASPPMLLSIPAVV